MSLKYLAQANTVAAITYFETVGWRGVMEREEGSRQPANFPSSPGEPFPVYDILAAVRGFTRARESLATNPQHVDALVLEDDTGRRRGIIANFTDEPQDVLIEGFATPVVRVEPMSYAIVDGRTQP
jgi:hypothetical protein